MNFKQLLIVCLLMVGSVSAKNDPKQIKAVCLDVNWGSTVSGKKINNFAIPGSWADLDPKAQVEWCKDLGVNVIQSFAVSCNGYAWYKGGEIEEQPNLKHDFLTELVKLGHKEDMKVMGYFCFGSNTKWGLDHPELSYGTPSRPHIPYTKQYIDYLCKSITEAFEITKMDGFMIDWFWSPNVIMGKPSEYAQRSWLECEKVMFNELMGYPFPGADKISNELLLEFNRRAIDRCWQAVRKCAKKASPDCYIWLSCSMLDHPEMLDQPLIKEVEWLQNEAGDEATFSVIKPYIGENTRLITTFSNHFFKVNNLKAEDVAAYAIKQNIGLYCYVSPAVSFKPISYYLETPPDSFPIIGWRNIAILARIFNNIPLDK